MAPIALTGGRVAMYTYIMQRTQIYLSEREAELLDSEARRTGRTRSSLIREAIQQRYDSKNDREETLRVLRETAGAWKREPGDETDDSVEFVKRLRGPGLGVRLRKMGR